MKTLLAMASKIRRKIKFVLRRQKNIHKLYIYPETQGGWIKYPDPLIGNKNTGSFFDPYVCRENDTFLLFVSDRDNGTIVRMQSKDGILWRDATTVLSAGNSCDWDAVVNRGCVRKIGNQWMLWYTGQVNGKSAIGVATSTDGICFEKYKYNPIIRPETNYEGYAVMNPSVLYDAETEEYQMWYCAGEQCEPDVICHAKSDDGFHWKKNTKNPVFCSSNAIYDCAKVGGCDVFRKVNGSYGMFYIGYQNIDNARICYAESENGIDQWIRSEYNPLISPGKDNWDAHAVYKPAFYYDRESHRGYLWYNGRKKLKECIGLATKTFDR